MPIIIFITVVNMVGFATIMPMLPLIQQLYNLSDHAVGYVIQLFVLSSIFGAIIFGILSDIFGRKYIILTACFIASIAYLLAGWTNDFSHFLVFRAINGFCNGSFSVAFAIATDLSSKETRLKNMSAIGAAFGISIVFGPSIGGFATSFGSNLKEMVAIPFFLASFFSFICAIITIILFKESLKIKSSSSLNNIYHNIIKNFFQLFHNKNFMFMTSINIAYTTMVMILQIYLGLWLFKVFHFSATNIGLFWSIGALFMISTQFIIQKYFTKTSSQKMVIFAFLGMALGYVILFASESKVFVLYIAFAIISINSAFLQASISTRLSLSDDSGSNIGLIFGMSQSLAGLGRTFGPFLGGIFISHFSYINTWGIIAVILCCLSLVSFIFFKRNKEIVA